MALETILVSLVSKVVIFVDLVKRNLVGEGCQPGINSLSGRALHAEESIS